MDSRSIKIEQSKRTIEIIIEEKEVEVAVGKIAERTERSTIKVEVEVVRGITTETRNNNGEEIIVKRMLLSE